MCQISLGFGVHVSLPESEFTNWNRSTSSDVLIALLPDDLLEGADILCSQSESSAAMIIDRRDQITRKNKTRDVSKSSLITISDIDVTDSICCATGTYEIVSTTAFSAEFGFI